LSILLGHDLTLLFQGKPVALAGPVRLAVAEASEAISKLENLTLAPGVTVATAEGLTNAKDSLRSALTGYRQAILLLPAAAVTCGSARSGALQRANTGVASAAQRSEEHTSELQSLA